MRTKRRTRDRGRRDRDNALPGEPPYHPQWTVCSARIDQVRLGPQNKSGDGAYKKDGGLDDKAAHPPRNQPLDNEESAGDTSQYNAAFQPGKDKEATDD